jgi:hypothetical protein
MVPCCVTVHARPPTGATRSLIVIAIAAWCPDRRRRPAEVGFNVRVGLPQLARVWSVPLLASRTLEVLALAALARAGEPNWETVC